MALSGAGVLAEFALDLPLGRIAGLRGGTPGAPRVLALHGWLDNAASFVPLAAEFERSGLHIELVAPDLPGHGRSAHLAPGADYSFAGALHAVLDIADALGWDQFALLGHSMGAGIASLVEQGQLNPRAYLRRHLSADWGDLDDSDRRQNDAALKSGKDRLFSSYEVSPNLKVWVITEWDHSVTTLLLPSEY